MSIISFQRPENFRGAPTDETLVPVGDKNDIYIRIFTHVGVAGVVKTECTTRRFIYTTSGQGGRHFSPATPQHGVRGVSGRFTNLVGPERTKINRCQFCNYYSEIHRRTFPLPQTIRLIFISENRPRHRQYFWWQSRAFFPRSFFFM